jgi:hypothetical protein
LKISLRPGFKQRMNGQLDRYTFEVGILEDGPHYQAKRGKRGLGGSDVLKQFAGGKARKQSRNATSTLVEVSKAMQENIKGNYLTKPFDKTSSDIMKFLKEFFKYNFGKSEKKRLENTLQAVVRNPILRGDYGTNSELTQKIKGFDRFGIDTGQWFKAIKARVKRKIR